MRAKNWYSSFRLYKNLFYAVMWLVLAGILAILTMYLIPTLQANGRMWDRLEMVPNDGRVAVVFGTTPQVQGRENLYFRHRMDAAVELWESGKVSRILVSGDNREIYYNEPEKMRQALIQRGVPIDVIVQDFAGLRTLDTVYRAKRIFGLSKVIFVSQSFHNERALFLAKFIGLDACGYNAKGVDGAALLWITARETLARGKMFLDVYVLRTEPTHLGVPIPIDLPEVPPSGR